MPKVSGEEAYLLKKASYKIRQYIRMGEEFSTGQSSVPDDKVHHKKQIPVEMPLDSNLNIA